MYSRICLLAILLSPIIEALPMVSHEIIDFKVGTIIKPTVHSTKTQVQISALHEDFAKTEARVLQSLLQPDPFSELSTISLYVSALQKIVPEDDLFCEKIIVAALLRENLEHVKELLNFFKQRHDITINNASQDLKEVLIAMSALAVHKQPGNVYALQFQELIKEYTN